MTRPRFTVKHPEVWQDFRWIRSISPANIRSLTTAGVGSLGDLAALEGRQLAAVAVATEIDVERLMGWVDHARDLLADCELMRGEMLPVEAENGDGDEGREL